MLSARRLSTRSGVRHAVRCLGAFHSAFLLHGMRREGLPFSVAALVVMISGALTALVAAGLVRLLYPEHVVDRGSTRIL